MFNTALIAVVVSVVLVVVPSAALDSALVQYSSASDTTLEMRVAVVYATPRLYAEAQFMFREVTAIDGSDGVSLVPAANEDSFVCDDGTGSGRLVVKSSPRSPSLCSFKKVAGLSNPSLVSFEQGGRYIGYAKAYDYDCAAWFDGKPGWTVGLVPRPAASALATATWVSSDVGPVVLYAQSTSYFLGNCSGDAIFTGSGDIMWEVVPALARNISPTAVSLRLRSNASLFLGVDPTGERQLHDGSATYVPIKVSDCAGREADCTWDIARPSSDVSGVVALRLAGSNWTLDRQSHTAACAAANNGVGVLSSTSSATLGLWRAAHYIPNTPAVVVNETSESAHVRLLSCSDFKLCRSCVTASMSCGWCSATSTCTQGTAESPGNCSASQWLFNTCVAETHDGSTAQTSIVAPLVGGIVGGVAVLSAVVVAAVLIARKKNRRQPTVVNLPVEGAPVGFTMDLTEATSVAMQLASTCTASGVAADSGSSGSGPVAALPVGMFAPQLPDNPSLELPPASMGCFVVSGATASVEPQMSQ
eukprot:m51a1_g6555 hypothetical protein (532) ;mRNA; f:104206-106006